MFTSSTRTNFWFIYDHWHYTCIFVLIFQYYLHVANTCTSVFYTQSTILGQSTSDLCGQHWPYQEFSVVVIDIIIYKNKNEIHSLTNRLAKNENHSNGWTKKILQWVDQNNHSNGWTKIITPMGGPKKSNSHTIMVTY